MAKWIEGWKNIYKTDSSPISENVQQGLIEKQFVHFDISMYRMKPVLTPMVEKRDFLIKLFDWVFDHSHVCSHNDLYFITSDNTHSTITLNITLIAFANTPQ